MSDLTTVSTDLFNKIRSRFSNVKMGDKSTSRTSNEAEARFFSFDYKTGGKMLGSVDISLMDGKLIVLYSRGIYENQPTSVKKSWYDFLQELRQFARKNRMRFDTRDMTKSNLDKRDYRYLANSSGELNMRESKLFGTSKTSYQDMGEAVIIVKHSQPVNYNIPAGRTQHIESIYIESASGERFKYPHKHLNGARAMARHIANGGTSYDSVGTYISGLSEELSKLRQFKNYTQRSGVMAEALGDLTEKVIERIDLVKQEISNLQKQDYYENFSNSFTPSEQISVPEDVMSGWVDALTIKTFNEELKSVFPFIYRLVSEKQEQGLSYDDLVAEAGGTSALEKTCPECHKDPCECEVTEDHQLKDFESYLENLTTFDYDFPVSEADEGVVWGVYEVLKDIYVGAKNGEEMTDTIADELSDWHLGVQASGDKTLQAAYKYVRELGANAEGNPQQMMDVVGKAIKMIEPLLSKTEENVDSQESNQNLTNEVIEFIASMYDREAGTFPRGEEGVKIAVEKKFGEHAGRFADYVVEKLAGAVVGGAIGAATTKNLSGAVTGAEIGSTVQDLASDDEEEEKSNTDKNESSEIARILRLSGMAK